jgi:hypothetical protein
VPEPASHAATEHPAPADAGRAPAGAAAGGHPDVPPYRARALHAQDGRWHLRVESLKDHPDRGEVDSVVVTLTPGRPQGGRPPAGVDAALRSCGFRRRGSWERHAGGWSAPCAQSDSRAAPPAPGQDDGQTG